MKLLEKLKSKYSILAVGLLISMALLFFLGLKLADEDKSLPDVNQREFQSSSELFKGEGYRINDQQEEQLKEQEEIKEQLIEEQKIPSPEPTKVETVVNEIKAKESEPKKGDSKDKGSSDKGKETPGGKKDDDTSGGGKSNEKSPKIITDLKDGYSYAGAFAAFTVRGETYLGEVIQWPGEYQLYLNGTAVEGSSRQVGAGVDDGKNYQLDLLEGENHIKIVIIDDKGNRAEKDFTVYGDSTKPPDENDIITVRLRLNLSNIGLGTPIPWQTVQVRRGQLASRIVKDFLESNGYSVIYTGNVNSGFYLKGLSRLGIASGWSITEEQKNLLSNSGRFLDADGNFYHDDDNLLIDKDFTNDSGFMWAYNYAQPSYAMSATTLEDGDYVEIWWTNALGKDFNGGWSETPWTTQ